MSDTTTTLIKQLGIQRYETERVSVRRTAVENTMQGACLELYAGQGTMRGLVFEPHFAEYITVDSDLYAKVMYHISAIKYIREFLPSYSKSIALVDFDAYGGPHFEIHEFFKVRGDKDRGIVIVITDGLGLMLKRSLKKARVSERYLVTDADNIDMRHCWKHMKEMTYLMMTRLAEKHGMKCIPLAAIPGKGQNFLFSAWKFV